MTYPTVDAGAIPWVTVDQMVEADRLAIEEFSIGLLQMMEHAGSALADVVMSIQPSGAVVVMAGAGNNGGGGLCAARHLVNRGRPVSVVLAGERLGAAAAHQVSSLAAMGVEPRTEPPDVPIAVDALVGYGLEGPLRGRSAELAAWSAGRTVVSLDIPSGYGFESAVEPEATLTLALPKAGMEELRPLYLADLGLPVAVCAPATRCGGR